MTLLQRRIMTAVLFAGLIILGPAIVFYGAGYRLNLQQKRLERAGLLHVTTEPENTIVTLNGTPYSSGKELILPSLSPGIYDIAVSKDGYHSWFKRLEVLPGQTTFIRDLNLFRKEEVQALHNVPATASLVHDGHLTVFQANERLDILSDGETAVREVTLPNAFQVILPAEGSDGSLYFQQNASWFRLIDDTLEELPVENGTGVRQIIPQSQLLYLVRTNAIWQMPAAGGDAESVLEQNFIQSARVNGEGFWILSSEPSKRHVFLSQTTEKNQRPMMLTSIAYDESYTIAEDIGGFLTIYSPTSKRLVLVDTNIVPPVTETYENVSAWEWSKNNRQLLVATEFELFILHLGNEKRQELLARLSTSIQDAAWEADENHIFFITENSLKLVERDERFQRNVIELARNEADMRLLQKNMKEVTFSSRNPDGSVDIFKLPLR